MLYQDHIESHISVMRSLSVLQGRVERAADLLVEAIGLGKKILVAGNGGSAADAQHFAGEIVGRFKKERRSWPALALTTDTSILTALGNDYGYDSIFARQVEGLGHPGDAFIGISTSGDSMNLQKAVEKARSAGLPTIGLLGNDGGRLAHMVDLPLIVPSRDTPRIQEAHIFLLHYLAGRIEEKLA